jgi:hypothetical protein
VPSPGVDEPQRPHARVVADAQEELPLAEGPAVASLLACPAGLATLKEGAAPAVGGGVRERRGDGVAGPGVLVARIGAVRRVAPGEPGLVIGERHHGADGRGDPSQRADLHRGAQLDGIELDRHPGG